MIAYIPFVYDSICMQSKFVVLGQLATQIVLLVDILVDSYLEAAHDNLGDMGLAAFVLGRDNSMLLEDIVHGTVAGVDHHSILLLDRERRPKDGRQVAEASVGDSLRCVDVGQVVVDSRSRNSGMRNEDQDHILLDLMVEGHLYNPQLVDHASKAEQLM